MALEDIPVVASEGLSGNAAALSREVLALLETLAAEGRAGSIDLAASPLTPANREWLRAWLGQGEVEIRLQAGGPSLMVETGIPGVWWVEHRDERNVLVATFIEVATVPTLVGVEASEVRRGLEQLRQRIHGLS